MKRTAPWALLAMVLWAGAASGQSNVAMRNRLTNQDVISMVQSGFSEDIIITKIRSAAAAGADAVNLDTSVEGLKALKAANVPDGVIKAMMSPGAAASTTLTTSAATSTSANLPPAEVGVYWKDGSNFVFVEGQAVNQAKIGGKAGSFFSYGVRGVHWDAFLNGPTSKNVVREAQPVFYMYVPEGTSASDFVLMKLNAKSDRREFQIGSFGGIHGGNAGVKRDKELPFKAEHVGIRTYRIVLGQGLRPGEYAFFMGTGAQTSTTTGSGGKGGAGAGGAAAGRVYDFTVPG